MKKKIIKFIFSLGAGFGLTVLVYISILFILEKAFELEESYEMGIISLIMGWIAFAIISGEIYDYLKKQ